MSSTATVTENPTQYNPYVGKCCTEIQVKGSVPAYGSMVVDEHGNVSDPHMDAAWGSYNTEEYECRGCGETFPSEAAAKDHLKRAQVEAGFWEMGLPATETEYRTVKPPEFTPLAEEVSANGHTVRARLDPSQTLGLLQDNHEELIDQSEDPVVLPPNFEFDGWGQLADTESLLTFDDGSPRISKWKLARAVKHLAVGAGATYNPDRYSLYPLETPMLVAGGEAILIAKRNQD